MSKQDGTQRVVNDTSIDDGSAPMLHVDMDAFFASVELLDRPELRGKPVIVAHDGPRSVVTTATYEARRYGVRAALPLARARQMCPRAVILEPHFDRYRELSQRAMAIFHRFTPLVEQVSIDEAFLDVAGAKRLYGLPGTIATMIRECVWSELSLRCTVGVARNKSVAKIASTLAKPDGLLIVPSARTQAFLNPLPVRSLWGVGPTAGEKLDTAGIQSVKDLVDTPAAVIDRLVGKAMGNRLRALARGQDQRGIALTREERSIGKEHTFETDMHDFEDVRNMLLGLVDNAARRMRNHGVEAGGIALKLRDETFRTFQRSRKLSEPTDVTNDIARHAIELLESLWPELDGRGVRLIGVRGERLSGASSQTALWDDSASWRAADEVRDALQAKFGDASLLPAALMQRKRRSAGQD